VIKHLIIFSALGSAFLCGGYVVWLIIADAIKGGKRSKE